MKKIQRVGGFGRFKIRVAGGFTANPLLPIVSNVLIPGIHAHKDPDETKGLTQVPKNEEAGKFPTGGRGVHRQPPPPAGFFSWI